MNKSQSSLEIDEEATQPYKKTPQQKRRSKMKTNDSIKSTSFKSQRRKKEIRSFIDVEADDEEDGREVNSRSNSEEEDNASYEADGRQNVNILEVFEDSNQLVFHYKEDPTLIRDNSDKQTSGWRIAKAGKGTTILEFLQG